MNLRIAMVLLICTTMTSANSPTTLPAFDKLWDYAHPEQTEKKFRELLPAAEKSGDASYHAQLLTQIARTYSLRGKYDEAHAILNDVEKMLTDDTKLARVRYLLERGRTFRSADRPQEALPLFHAAMDLSRDISEWRYHIDAIHMLAITEAKPEDQLKWNLAGIKLVEEHPDQRGWLYALYNNNGETYIKLARYEDALKTFQKLVALDEENKKQLNIYAQLDVTRCLNLLKRHDEALKQLQGIEKRDEAKDDGYFHEQLGEALNGVGKTDEARTHSKRAYELIGKEEWLQQDPLRLARLKQLAGITSQ